MVIRFLSSSACFDDRSLDCCYCICRAPVHPGNSSGRFAGVPGIFPYCGRVVQVALRCSPDSVTVYCVSGLIRQRRQLDPITSRSRSAAALRPSERLAYSWLRGSQDADRTHAPHAGRRRGCPAGPHGRRGVPATDRRAPVAAPRRHLARSASGPARLGNSGRPGYSGFGRPAEVRAHADSARPVPVSSIVPGCQVNPASVA